MPVVSNRLQYKAALSSEWLSTRLTNITNSIVFLLRSGYIKFDSINIFNETPVKAVVGCLTDVNSCLNTIIGTKDMGYMTKESRKDIYIEQWRMIYNYIDTAFFPKFAGDEIPMAISDEEILNRTANKNLQQCLDYIDSSINEFMDSVGEIDSER